jgi:hypothetical protein
LEERSGRVSLLHLESIRYVLKEVEALSCRPEEGMKLKDGYFRPE